MLSRGMRLLPSASPGSQLTVGNAEQCRGSLLAVMHVIPLNLRVMVSRPSPGGLREAEQFAPSGLGRCVCVC